MPPLPGQIPVAAAAAWAGRAHARLLLATGATVGVATRAEIGSLQPVPLQNSMQGL